MLTPYFFLYFLSSAGIFMSTVFSLASSLPSPITADTEEIIMVIIMVIIIMVIILMVTN